MIRLEPGNVLLKPSHRRQLMSWMKRSQRLGDRVGDFDLTLSLRRSGRHFEASAQVRDSAGQFTCRSRKSRFQSALKELAWSLSTRLHEQRLQAGG